MQNASDALTTVVKALGWERPIQHPSFFYPNVVREFYAGIAEPKDSKPQYYSVVKGVPVKFDSKEINECYGLSYQGLSFDKNYVKWGKKEMEVVKKAITIRGTPWEPCSANEFKVKRSSLNHDAMVWFNFIEHSLLPTSHTTNVEKERMMLLDAILGGKGLDIRRLICREILVCQGENAGYLLLPCLISDLCVNAGVEMKGEKKSYPVTAFPTVLKAKPSVAVASGDPTMLQQFMLQQRAIWESQRKQHMWLTATLAANLKENASMLVPTFPDRVIDEEMIDDVLFKDELNEEEEAEVIVEKKIKRKEVKASKKEIKKGKRKVGEEEEDLLETEFRESLSEGEKQENIEVMKELNKESDEEDPTTSEEDEFQDAGEDLGDATILK